MFLVLAWWGRSREFQPGERGEDNRILITKQSKRQTSKKTEIMKKLFLLFLLALPWTGVPGQNTLSSLITGFDAEHYWLGWDAQEWFGMAITACCTSLPGMGVT